MVGGLRDLGTSDVALFNLCTGSPPQAIRLCGDHCNQPQPTDEMVPVSYSYTMADADLNGDYKLTRAEEGPNELEGYEGSGAKFLAAMFEFTGYPFPLQTANAVLGLIPKMPLLTWGFRRNDGLVTLKGAQYDRFANLPYESTNAVFPRNHGSVLREDGADTILGRIRSSQPSSSPN